MAFRAPMHQLAKRASTSSVSRFAVPAISRNAGQLRSFATPVPPVTQDATGSKGPTAMVFMNMGGPAHTDQVGDFLSRLFVCALLCLCHSPNPDLGRWGSHSSWALAKLPRASDIVRCVSIDLLFFDIYICNGGLVSIAVVSQKDSAKRNVQETTNS